MQTKKSKKAENNTFFHLSSFLKNYKKPDQVKSGFNLT